MRHRRQQLCAVALALLVSAVVTGCATHAPRVNCGGRLEPINAPAPAAKPVPSRAVPAP